MVFKAEILTVGERMQRKDKDEAKKDRKTQQVPAPMSHQEQGRRNQKINQARILKKLKLRKWKAMTFVDQTRMP